jgi:hypothetical protein
MTREVGPAGSAPVGSDVDLASRDDFLDGGATFVALDGLSVERCGVRVIPPRTIRRA